MYINDVFRKELTVGQGFGEFSLLYNVKRSATIKALKNTSLWAIERKAFRDTINL